MSLSEPMVLRNEYEIDCLEQSSQLSDSEPDPGPWICQFVLTSPQPNHEADKIRTYKSLERGALSRGSASSNAEQ